MGKWYKVKNGRMTRIKKPVSISALNMQGYTVTHVIEIGNNTRIVSYSPLTRQEAFDKQRGIRQG
jgi:hypothetical protein